jgi:hypothetical protein
MNRRWSYSPLAVVLGTGLFLVLGGCCGDACKRNLGLSGIGGDQSTYSVLQKHSADAQQKAIEADRFPTAKQAGL